MIADQHTGRNKPAENNAAGGRIVRLLIADDDPGIRDIFTIIFKREGYSVEMKNNRLDLLNDQFTIPDLFIIDKQLSGYDGLEICRYLKKNPRTNNIPVLMISASPDISGLAMSAGADAWLEKPFEMQELLDRVRQYT